MYTLNVLLHNEEKVCNFQPSEQASKHPISAEDEDKE
jgi:hypothetical protein